MVLAAAAEDLVAIHFLRTLDAIHVASAHVFVVRAGVSDLLFVSADHRQAEAATAIGLAAHYVS